MAKIMQAPRIPIAAYFIPIMLGLDIFPVLSVSPPRLSVGVVKSFLTPRNNRDSASLRNDHAFGFGRPVAVVLRVGQVHPAEKPVKSVSGIFHPASNGKPRLF